MNFDLDKLQAVAELGEVIRLQNEALERLATFRKQRPHMIMPNLAKVVEENIKENVMVLYKELNNLHKPAEQQTRYICKECNLAFLVSLPGGICDECRAKIGPSQPRNYVPYQGKDDDDDESAAAITEPAEQVSENDTAEVEPTADAPDQKTDGSDTVEPASSETDTAEAKPGTQTDAASGDAGDDISKLYASSFDEEIPTDDNSDAQPPQSSDEYTITDEDVALDDVEDKDKP